jgi:type I restriction enzyme, S subunit
VNYVSIQTGTQVNKDLLYDSGQYPVYYGGIKPSGYHVDFNSKAETIAISQGGASAGYVNWVSTPFFAGAHCFTLKNVSKQILNRYLYYCLKNEQKQIQSFKQGAGIPGLNCKVLKSLRIPLPPLSIQQEIVRILDTFTALEAELDAELEARNKQFNYYLSYFLESSDTFFRVCLKDVAIISNGRDHKHLGEGEYPVYGSGGIMRYVDTCFLRRRIGFDTKKGFNQEYLLCK